MVEAETITFTDEQKQVIIDELVSEMQSRISDMDIEYPGGDTDGWKYLSESSWGDLEVKGLYLEFEYTLSCRYDSWTEYWTDPVCYPSFSDTDSEEGEIDTLTITDEDGNEVDDETLNEIINKVNNILNPPKDNRK